ncbi:predicted protein [Naegleria gruberi]|uniref:Predicted protein n=1 Tax=Naegleria gruberi TaxID=5762 RepID=D2V8G2_NAEGR|nr:uncharacterized protein NAEGRDRAFT_65144 [Naegleria gruberi]EFC46678.1 predicted protein [Naegleria gruberi]|eukprot:XP_002679422.1 predicted protein [Naegleria gruberi strain NEG-M]
MLVTNQSQTLKEELNTITTLFEQLHAKANEKIALLEKKEKEWKIRQDQIEENIKKCPDKVILNIGGKTFASTKDTLLSKKDSFFYAMLSSGNWLPDQDGTYFIDRDPKYFRYLLNYLRTGERPDLSELSKVKLKELQKEANFYCLDDMFGNDSSLEILAMPSVKSTIISQRKVSIVGDDSSGTYIKTYNLTKLESGTFRWKINIHSFTSWLGIGVVMTDRVEKKIFNDFVTPYKEHGCYMASANCYLWQAANGYSANSFPLKAGDEMMMELSCESQVLTITNTSTNAQLTIPNVSLPAFPCIVTNGKFSIDLEWVA